MYIGSTSLPRAQTTVPAAVRFVAAPDFSGPRGAPAPATAPAPPTSAVGGVVFPSSAPAAIHTADYPSSEPGATASSPAVPTRASAVEPAGGPRLGPTGLGQGSGSVAEGVRFGVAAGAGGGADAGVPDQVLVRGGHLIAPQQRTVMA